MYGSYFLRDSWGQTELHLTAESQWGSIYSLHRCLGLEHRCLPVGYTWWLAPDFRQEFCRRIRFLSLQRAFVDIFCRRIGISVEISFLCRFLDISIDFNWNFCRLKGFLHRYLVITSGTNSPFRSCARGLGMHWRWNASWDCFLGLFFLASLKTVPWCIISSATSKWRINFLSETASILHNRFMADLPMNVPQSEWWATRFL